MKIYYTSVSELSDEKAAELLKCVPAEKQQKLLSVRNIAAKKESIAAWYLLFKDLSERGIESYSIAFSDKGKPYFEDLPLCFSLTHSAGFVCCAVSEKEVGIDAEQIKTVKDSVIKKVLTPDERATLLDKDSSFIRYWTMKESLLKHCGSGISEELFTLDFSNYAESEEFFFRNLLFTVIKKDGFYISVCGEEKDRNFIEVKL